MENKITKANKKDSSLLTELSLRSKNHWNYGTEQIEEWREELTLDSDYVSSNKVYKLVEGGKLIGFYAYQTVDTTTVKLNYFFVEPEYIGKGYGKMMMINFLNRMVDSDFENIVLDSDPFAEKFYKNFGFKVIGNLKSSIQGRTLPIMKLKINHIEP